MSYESSKYSIAEQILKMIYSGNVVQKNDITIRQIIALVSQERNKLIMEFIYQLKAQGENFVPYDILTDYDITTASDGNIQFSTIPVRTLTTLHNQMGIYQVFLKNDPTEQHFIPTNVGARSMTRNLESFDVEGLHYYYPVSNRIFFPTLTEPTEIRLRAIVDSNSIGDRQFLPMPPDMEATLIQNVFQKLAPQTQIPTHTEDY